MTEKMVIREYYELCDGGICQDLLTEAEKRFVNNGGMILSGVIQDVAFQTEMEGFTQKVFLKER